MKSLLIFLACIPLMLSAQIKTFKYTNATGITSKVTNSGSTTTLQLWVGKSAVGLSKADNTADKDKPISIATRAELDKMNLRVSSMVTPDKTLLDSIRLLRANLDVVYGELYNLRNLVQSFQSQLDTQKTIQLRNFNITADSSTTIDNSPYWVTEEYRLTMKPRYGTIVFQTDKQLGWYGYVGYWVLLYKPENLVQ